MATATARWLLACCFLLGPRLTEGSRRGFYVLRPERFEPLLREDFSWAVANVPFIDVPLPDVQTAYYYRWRSYKKHISWTRDGWVITEFLPKVSWAGKDNTIPAAAGHHLMEGRWIHNRTYLDDYLTFWFRRGGSPRSYSSWFAWAAWQRHMVLDDSAFIVSLLPDLLTNLRAWTTSHHGTFWGRNCWWQTDGKDAMEVSISGSGCRPTINSMMYGEAVALLEIARLAGNTTLLDELSALRAAAQGVVLHQLWNPKVQSFAVIPLLVPALEESSRHRGCPGDGVSSWRVNETVSVRELLAFTPWYFSLPTAASGQLIPPNQVERYSSMWRQLFDPQGFAAPWGLRTAELRSPCYNYSYAHRDCWNGPSWPYETARVLTGAANLLNDYPETPFLSEKEYYALLEQYARQHTSTAAANDTAKPLGSGHIFEVLHPDDGYWINREFLYATGGSLKDRGDDYNHSTFCDLILSGLFGLRPRSDSLVVVNPLATLGLLSHFAVDHILYHGHYLSIVWDSDGSHYALGQGIKLLIDGDVAASSSTLERLSATLPAEVLYA